MFNTEARWDRHLPQDESLPGDYVNTVVSFNQGGVSPLWFFLNSDKHIIKNINFKWQDKKGKEVFELFSVSDMNNCQYTLCFSKQRMRWKVIQEE